MKKLYLLTLATFALGSGLAFAQPENKKGDDHWLQTGTRWTRSDFYGKDLNQNGRIDGNEWTERLTKGSGKQPAWGQTPLRDGESHRWSVSTEEVFEEQPVKAKTH